ncbi:MAG TPA: GNAT family N-acetyltransferase [Roseiflexaceae bacterium]|nr:GNAT family N-acetyltransferase [Roseiflexaceae bacterium]HMP40620.1 GNAT family N-acetyltransferase [Roseiflexaceae bacterium]
MNFFPTYTYSVAELATIFNQSFEGYIMPAHIDAATFDETFRAVDVDHTVSFVCEQNGMPVGLLLVSRRGWSARISAMGVVAVARRQGIGRLMMQRAIEEARQRSDRVLLLEVIEQNMAAVKLYHELGFETIRRLHGFQQRSATPLARPLVEIDPLVVVRQVIAEGDPDLPWQLAGETLRTSAPPMRGFMLDETAFALISNPEDDPIRLQALVVAREARRCGMGRLMLAALAAAYPGRAWQISPLVPEGPITDFVTACGWQPHPITQLELRMTLS